MPLDRSRDPALVVTSYEFAPADVARLKGALGPDALLLVSSQEELLEAVRAHPETDVVCGFRPPIEVLERAPRLRWIALASAGVEFALERGLVREHGPIVTNARGVHAVPIGEFVLGVMLQWARKWPELHDLQRAATWPDHGAWLRLRGTELDGMVLGVVGLGAIGRHVARLGRAFGMRVLAVRRTVRKEDDDADVDALLPQARLAELLRAADYVVLCVPSTPETHHLIQAGTLALMKRTAFLVNISRGSVINEADLVVALRSGIIAGAGLDVFEVEPLPRTNPLWTLPNVIVAPHISGNTDRYSARLTDLFLDNLARLRAGQPLRNVIDPDRGY